MMKKAKKAKNDFFTKYIIRNFKLKILALVISVALWFFVTEEKVSEVGMFVALETRGVPKGMVVVSKTPETIEVRFFGPKAFIAGLSPSEIKAELDLKDALEGLNVYKLAVENISVPGGVEVVKINPKTVYLTIEKPSEAKR
ncbi:MAG: CdaR family protein [Thermodesulfobacteriota bacterium]